MSVTTLEEQSGISTLRRNLIIYGPTTILAIGLFVISANALIGGAWGAIVPAVLLGLLAFALGIQLVGSIRDLRTEPTFTRGPIRNTWRKSALLVFFRQHFVLLGRHVFTVSVPTFAELQVDDVIEVHFWPHTRTVIRVAILSSSEATAADEIEGPIVPITLPTHASLGQHSS